jgi:hypothetical protein
MKDLESRTDALYDQRIVNLNRKVNLLLALILVLLLLLGANLLMTYRMMAPSEPLNVTVTNL